MSVCPVNENNNFIRLRLFKKSVIERRDSLEEKLEVCCNSFIHHFKTQSCKEILNSEFLSETAAHDFDRLVSGKKHSKYYLLFLAITTDFC